jgi:hypothetical protein
MATNGAIRDAKTISGIMWLASTVRQRQLSKRQG